MINMQPKLNGYQLLARAMQTELIAFDMPEPFKSQLKERAMNLYHESALDENERRDSGDTPDHIHLAYL